MKPYIKILSFFLTLSLAIPTGCSKPVTEPEDIEDDPHGGEVTPTREYPYEITSTTTIENLEVFMKQKNMGDLYPTAEEYIGVLAKSPVVAINYTYPSIGPDGKEVTLSSRLYMLKSMLGVGRTTLGTVLINHPTIIEASQCPTLNLSEEAAIAWAGLAVVMPDYYGFGASADKPQAFLNSECTAKGSIDAFKTARQILRDRGTLSGRDNYNIGYSQGGFNAIANLKYIHDHPDDGVKFIQTFAGAGPYDINATLDEYLAGKYPEGTVFLPITAISANECGNLGIDYAGLFREPLLSNYQEWILSKKYPAGTIMRNIGTYDISKILTEETIDGSGAGIRKLREVFESFSLISGWSPRNGTKILLYHSTQDDVIPIFNSDELYGYLSSIGADVKYVKGEGGDHNKAVLAFLQAVASEIIQQ